jgi:hypothetical protein
MKPKSPKSLELWHYDKMGIPGEALRPDNEKS